MKKTLMPLVRCMVVLLLFAIPLTFFSSMLSDKTHQQKYMDFYEASHEYDVILLGTSHMHNTVSCMQFWQDYGISAYNFAYSNCRIPESYWMLRHLLRYTKPQAVVIDLFQLDSDDKYRGGLMEQRHVQFDSMPLDLLKIQAVLDMFDNYDYWFDFLWPFAKYHGRWDSLTSKDFHVSSTYENGSDIKVGLHGVHVDHIDPIDVDDTLPINSVSVRYLEKIAALCAEEGIDLVLMVTPYSICTPEEQRRYHYAASKLATDHVFYLNMISDENIHYQTDSYDLDHLNMAGSCKVTDTLGRWLQTELSIPNHRGDNRFAQMDEIFSAYTSMRTQQIKAEEDPTNYLIRLYDSCFLYNASMPEGAIQSLNEAQRLLLDRAQYSHDETLSEFTSDGTLLEINVYDRLTKELIDHVQLTSSSVIR